MRFMLAGVLCCMWMVAVPVLAQGTTTLTEAEYWSLLGQTRDDLERALRAEGTERVTTLTQVAERWQNVANVRLDDGLIAVETSWLQLPPDADSTTIQTTMNRITAVQNFQSGRGIPLDGLGNVPQPEPPQESAPRREIRINPAVAGIARIVLIAMGVVAVIAVLFLVARGLRLTSAALPAAATYAEEDPQTSDDARNRAKSSEQVQDYRAAVRYLYLSSLLMLDESGLIRYDPTLTNQEHLVQIDDRPNLRTILTPIINFFDRTWYGFAPISDADYQQFRQQVDRLQQLAAESST